MASVVDTTAPTVMSVTPVNGATNVSPSVALTVLFDEAMDPASIDGTTVELRDGANSLVAATVSYDAGTRTATLTPGTALAEPTTYSALVRGGATDPRVKDVAGNALAADFTLELHDGSSVDATAASGTMRQHRRWYHSPIPRQSRSV